MLLAAGAGSRLRPLTDNVPKPLAPIANVPLLEHTVTWLVSQGVDDIIINFHQPGQYGYGTGITRLTDGGRQFGVRISYSEEEELLGTSGAVKRCEYAFKNEPFFVIYGDNLIDADLIKLYQFHVSSKAAATIALFTPDNPSASGMVDVDLEGKITGFVEKPLPGESAANMANAGVYVIDPSLLSTLPDGFSDFGSDIFPQWIREGRPLFATPLGGYLQDTGTFDRYRKANWDLLRGATRYTGRGDMIGQNLVATTAVIQNSAELSGRNIIGEHCAISEGSRLSDCIVWERSQIYAGCTLTNVIVGRGAHVPEGTELADCAVI